MKTEWKPHFRRWYVRFVPLLTATSYSASEYRVCVLSCSQLHTRLFALDSSLKTQAELKWNIQLSDTQTQQPTQSTTSHERAQQNDHILLKYWEYGAEYVKSSYTHSTHTPHILRIRLWCLACRMERSRVKSTNGTNCAVASSRTENGLRRQNERGKK